MNKLVVNNKVLNIPSFFYISNLGGGGSDKYREIVYLNFYRNIPVLFNYYYLKYPNFSTEFLKKIDNYKNINDFYSYVSKNYIERDLYDKKNITLTIDNEDYNFVSLLDSGSANIINKLSELYNPEQVIIELKKVIKDYYDFSHNLKFDLVTSFDLGGKYTFKGNERFNPKIEALNKYIYENSKKINRELILETINYLKSHNNFYPKILLVLHGNNKEELGFLIDYVLDLEIKYNFKFFGFALGGVAGNKKNKDWGIKKGETVVSLAASVANKKLKGRYIHALGCGGYNNIEKLLKNRISSYDSQTPGRRAYDGSGKTSDYKKSYSKMLIPKYLSNGKIINERHNFEYLSINEFNNNIDLCDCPACSYVRSIGRLKELYNSKSLSDESYYLARQIMNSHSIWQHIYFSKIE